MLFLLPIQVYPEIAMVYPLIFKQFDQNSKKKEESEEDIIEKHVDAGDTEGDVRDRLDYRLIGYWLVLLGLLRCLIAFCSSCFADRIGIFTFGVEILFLCNELLRVESVLLHRTMAMILECVVMIIICMAAKLPECVSA